MKRYCLTLDLKNDPELIREYEEHHQKIWPEIVDSIKASGINSMEIYRLGTRLLMVMEVSDDFSFEKKAGKPLDLKKLSRKQLICDMQHPKNIMRWLFYIYRVPKMK